MNEVRRGPGPGGPPDRGGPGGRQTPTIQQPSDVDLRAIIVEGSAQRLVEVAQDLGRALKNEGLTTSQIRSFFGEVRRIEMNWPIESEAGQAPRALRLLRPKLAYQSARGQGPSVQHLRGVLDPAIVLVEDDRERFQNLVDFFEAILAYHRSFGGN